jgi:hypothetical protein
MFKLFWFCQAGNVFAGLEKKEQIVYTFYAQLELRFVVNLA